MECLENESTVHQERAGATGPADRFLEESNDHLKLLANVFENVAESIIITDIHGIIETVNPAFTAVNGFRSDEVVGKTPRCIKSGRHSSQFYKWIWHDILKTGSWKGKIWNRRKNGEIYPALLSIAAIRDGKGKTTHYCSVCHDITGRTDAMDRLQFEAYHDALTGLPNMQLFYDRLERALYRAGQNRATIAILVVNLDGFRKFNEEFGYRRGDLLLQQVARRLKLVCRNHDTLTRPAADEFIMIVCMDDTDNASVARRAEQIMKSFSVPLNLKGTPVSATIRIGISIYPLTAGDMHTLLEQAQAAVRRAKQKGGNRYLVYPL
jgi:diguanylate cyclase (GGDEF)-like protein/PAS domain S-box-containing protein